MVKASPIKVLHIASGDLWAGAEVQLFTLATTLHNRADVDVAVVLMNHGKLEQNLRDAGVEVIVIDESKFNGFQILLQLIDKLRATKPDVVHTHRIKENILGSIAARVGGNIPSLRTAHGASEHRPPWYHFPKRLIQFLDKFSGRHLQHGIIAVSDDLAGILKTVFPEEKIKIIENGINPANISQSANKVNADKQDFEPPYKIGIAGRLVLVKRIDIFIQTAAQFHERYPEVDISFHIFGDGPLRAELEALVHELGADGTVHFEGQSNNIHQELAELDALLITSDHEGLPMIALEAMVLETPVIAHAVGGIPVLLDQGSCGVLVSDHAPSAYAKAIYDLCANPIMRRDIIKNAATRVSDSYSNEKNADLYCSVYRSLMW